MALSDLKRSTVAKNWSYGNRVLGKGNGCQQFYAKCFSNTLFRTFLKKFKAKNV